MGTKGRSGLMGLAALLALAGAALPAMAGEWDISGSLGFESRFFLTDPQFPGQFEGHQPSLIVEPDIRWESTSGNHQVVLLPFWRIDTRDDERTHVDLREAYWRGIFGDYEVLVGLKKVFWGVTESRHLVDVVNQTDAVEDVDEEDKLGQPMVQLTTIQDWGTLSLFAMSGFRDRNFPGPKGRLRTQPYIDDDTSEFDNPMRHGSVDVALRYANYFGDWDVGLSVFHGLSREPRLRLAPTLDRLVPVYDTITQAGLDIQYTKDAWLWKLEAIGREGQGNPFGAAVAGFEYTLYQIFEKPWDLGLLAEYLYDGRDDFELAAPGDVSDAPPTAFQNDVFAGGRFALNDAQDTALLAGAIADAETGSTAILIEGERRLGDSWFVEIESRLFLAVDEEDALVPFEDDDFVTFRLTRHF